MVTITTNSCVLCGKAIFNSNLFDWESLYPQHYHGGNEEGLKTDSKVEKTVKDQSQ